MKLVKNSIGGALLITLATIPNPAYAGFLSWCSGTTSGLVVAGALSSGIGAPVGIAGGVAQSFGLLGTWAGLDPSIPLIALPPEPSPLPSLSSFLNANNYQQFSLPGNQYDELIRQTNLMVNSMNAITQGVRSGASLTQLIQYSQSGREALLGAAQAYDQLVLLGIEQPFRINQNSLNNAIAHIASSGLPQVEIDFLEAAGWTDADIDSLGQYVGDQTYNLNPAVNNISISDCFVCIASTLQAVPEPTSTISLLALGTLGAASTLKRQLKSSKPSEKETTKVG